MTTDTSVEPNAPSSAFLAPESLEGDLIQPGHPLFGLIWINPARMSGAPCFAGTRVPVQNLFDYLGSGYSLDQFLDDFECLTRNQVTAVIEVAGKNLLTDLPKP